jgi:uncharacterized protein (DUF952 family)
MELHHIMRAEAWEAAQAAGEHAPPELHGDGFLHCCTAAQLDFVLQRHFADATDLVILTFEPDDIQADLVWEKSEPDQDPFPHLYGALPCRWVKSAAAWPPPIPR